MEEWHNALPPAVLVALSVGAGAIAKWTSFEIATAFSGSDVVVLVLFALAAHWAFLFGTQVRVEHVFSCEASPEVREFIASTSSPGALFQNADSLGRASAPATDGERVVSTADLFVAGFVCKSLSKLNVNRSSNVGCVQSGTGTTGESFQHVADYVFNHRPGAVVLENLPDTGQTTAEVPESDAAWIVRWFEEHNYECQVLEVAAEEYGSAATRKRYFWLAFRGRRPGNPRGAVAKAVIAAVKIDPVYPLSAYLLPKDARQVERLPHAGPKRKRLPHAGPHPGDEKEGPNWKDEHLALFALRMLKWPPRSRRSSSRACAWGAGGRPRASTSATRPSRTIASLWTMALGPSRQSTATRLWAGWWARRGR